MRRIDLDMDEDKKYETIKRLVDNNGNKRRAANELGVSRRHVNRLIAGYKKEGKEYFVHGNKGRRPEHTMDEETKNLIKDLYRTKYFGANFTHYSELLEKYEGIKVSSNTIRTILMEEYILSPKARRATRKNIKKELEQLKEKAPTKKESNKIQTKIINIEDAHPRRPRCKYFGEMQQMDASPHEWFSGIISHLHIAVDDNSGAITGAYFDHQETLNGYYNVLYRILNEYGIPAMFFTDKRTVFEYKKKASNSLEDDTFTQFGYACRQLGIEIKTSSVPEAKGRVERMFQTLQSRLPIELRLAGVTSIEEANEFLKTYIKEFNAKFALPINHSTSVFDPQPSNEKINLILAVIAERKIDSGHSIKYYNKYYKFLDGKGHPVYCRKGTECMVISAFDKQLFASVEDRVYALEEIPEHEAKSKRFDFEKPKPEPKKRYIPPMNHPWRKAAFVNYIKKQAHRQQETA